MEQGEAIKSTTFFITKAVTEITGGVVMIDMFDKDFNRMYFHKTVQGEFIFDAYYLHDRVKGNTEKNIKNIYEVIDLLEEHGVKLIYTAERENGFKAE